MVHLSFLSNRFWFFILFFFTIIFPSFGQIQFEGCRNLITSGNFSYTLNQTGSTNDGGIIRNTYNNQAESPASVSCSAGVCYFSISWNTILNRWEIILDPSGTNYLLYINTTASYPNPPSLTLGGWTNEQGCSNILVLTGDVQNTISTATLASITTTTQANVTATNADLGGNVTSDGGATVTERGIVWATTSSPTISNTKVQIGTGTGVFNQNIGGLPPNTTIFVRSYAINSQGTVYGNQINFATLNTCSAPTAQITNLSVGNNPTTTTLDVVDYTAPIGGADGYVIKINSINSFTSLTNSSSLPTSDLSWNNAGEQVIYTGTSINPNIIVTGLNPNTQYFFRVYAYRNCAGINTFETTGTSDNATTMALTPEINLLGNNISIPSGSTVTGSSNHTDLGQTLGASLDELFVVQNIGMNTLTISSITSSNPSFVVSNAPNSVVVNGQESFQITFSPTISGVQTSTITINNNDSNEGSYTFVVKGEGICPITSTISASVSNIAPNQVGSIYVNSKLGATYQLQNVSNGNTNVGNPIQGTGSSIYLQTPPLPSTTDFRVVASRGLDCGNQILNTITITVSGNPYGYQQTQLNGCSNNTSIADIDVTINGTNYLWNNSATTQDIDDVMNGLYSIIIDGTTTLPVIVGTPVEWENLIKSTVSLDGRIISSGTFAWDGSEAAATSKAVLEANEDGGFTYLIENLATIPNSMIGLSTPNLTAAYTSIKNSFYVAADGSLFVYYNNTLSQDTQIDVAVNDRLTMTRVGNEIRYYHNSTLVYTDISAANQTNRLVVDIAMIEGQSPQVWFSKCVPTNLNIVYSQSMADDCTTGIGEGTINLSPQSGVAPYSYLWADANTSNPRSGLSVGLQNVTITDAATNSQVIPVVIGVPIVWTDLQNVVQNSGILAAESTASYTTAGAISAAGFTGDGGITYFYDITNTTYMVGLSAINSDPAWTSLGYSIATSQNQLTVYEDGTLVHTNTSLNDGDRISILRQSGVIKYYINERMVYTSAVTPATTLYADATVSQGFSPLVYASFCTQVATNMKLNYLQTSIDDCTTGAAEGAITLTGSGGTTATYSYNWDSGASTANPRNALARGLYSVNMTNGASNKVAPVVVGGLVNWTNLTANTTQTAGTVTTNTPASWTSPEGGISSNRLAANVEGGVTYIINDLSKAGNYQIGLSLPTATTTTWETLGYSAYIGLQNRFIIYEGGTQYGPFEPILAGDRISIIRRAGNIEYYVNSTLIRQIATTMTDELAVDISFIKETSPVVYASFCNPGFRIPNKIEAVQKVDITNIEKFVIYPNPSAGIFKVHFETVLLQNTQITIFDGIGRKITTQTFQKGKQDFKINLKNQPKGIYMIHLNQKKNTKTKIIIVE